jgi:predicted TIM-barrel fold metal-dependent hydrolase
MAKHDCKYILQVGLVALIVIIVASIALFSKPALTIDTHEHVESLTQAELLLAANESVQIDKTILIPSPIETLTLNGSKSFTGYRENTDEIFEIAEKHPDRFIPFCTVSPMDPDALEYLRSCVERGGKGLKLFNGHSYYYQIFGIPLDSPRMLPIYAYAERNELPILYHVNITKYGEELGRVLDKYPDLVVSVPHYMVSSIGIEKVAALLDKYPNLYTDASFGSPEFMAAGFRRISKNTKKYANFINSYQDRVLFGADMVLTNTKHKDQAFMEEVLTCYKDILEERRFTCEPVISYYETALAEHQDRYDKCKPTEGDYCQSLLKKVEAYQERLDQVTSLNGLGLSTPVLKKIYSKNPTRFLQAND